MTEQKKITLLEAVNLALHRAMVEDDNVVMLGEDIGGRPMLIVAVMLFVAAAQMISTGILAEILARPDGEAKNYYVRQTHRRA